jgi:choline kinase
MSIKCLIIAAGKGSRLQRKGDSKPLIPILGIPLIERVIRSALEVGADDFYVVTGCRGEHVRAFLDRLTDRLGIRITSIVNQDWDKENGLSVLKAREYLPEPFLLLMADHLFDPSIARELMEFPLAEGEIALGVDGDVRNPLVDMEDVTRVKTKGGRICNIGKGLTDFNGFDTGIFLCTPAIFDAVECCKEEYGDITLSGAVRVLAAEGRAKAVDICDRFWIDVDNPADFRRAENALLAKLRGKPNDGPVSRDFPLAGHLPDHPQPNLHFLVPVFHVSRRTVHAWQLSCPFAGRYSGPVRLDHRWLRWRNSAAQVPKE